jgi:hypothetical protein
VDAEEHVCSYSISSAKKLRLWLTKAKPGTYEVEWNASNYPSGVYFYNLNAAALLIQKLVILK